MYVAKFILTGFFLLPLTVNSQLYSYDNPKSWSLTNPECGSIRQSPIALSHKQATPLFVNPIVLHNFDKPFAKPVKITNNGVTIELDIEKTANGHNPFIFGGPLGAVYDVEALHFHWGSPTGKGSEHQINGVKYDLEMHIVCKNIKFSTLEEARNNTLGLAVMSILFKETQLDVIQNLGFNAVVNLLPKVSKYTSSMTSLLPSSMTSLIGQLNTKRFFTYQGSLTSPPCSQVVTWIVFEDAIPIPRTKLQMFWNISDFRGQQMVNNFRPIQPTNGRGVFYRRGFLN